MNDTLSRAGRIGDNSFLYTNSNPVHPHTMTSTGPAAPSNHLLLLHGLFGNPGQWSTAEHAAGPAWKVERPRLPLLEVEGGKGAIDHLARLMIELMDAARMDRTVVGGNSLGGHVAVRMALQYPDRVSGLVLTGSSGLFERGLEKSIPRRPTEEYIRTKMTGVFHSPRHCTAELINDVMRVVGNLRHVMQMMRVAACAKRDNLRGVLHSVTCPVLLIWGRDDQVTPPATGEEFAQLLPNAELHFLPECGHVPMVEQPSAFNALLTRFLGRVSGAVSACLASASLGLSCI